MTGVAKVIFDLLWFGKKVNRDDFLFENDSAKIEIPLSTAFRSE